MRALLASPRAASAQRSCKKVWVTNDVKRDPTMRSRGRVSLHATLLMLCFTGPVWSITSERTPTAAGCERNWLVSCTVTDTDPKHRSGHIEATSAGAIALMQDAGNGAGNGGTDCSTHAAGGQDLAVIRHCTSGASSWI